jgi:hypothetical protein
MTRSPLVERRRGRRRVPWRTLPLLVASACSGRSLSLGGDPLALSSTQGGGTGGTITGGTGAVEAGGVGGTTGGTGGTTGGTGGTAGVILIPGNGGSGAEAATGGADHNPYPLVTWQDGQGYRGVCPEYDDTSGFTCWNEASGSSNTCALDGTPICNACSCAIPCDESADCPLGLGGETAVCVGTSSNVKSCFLSCEGVDCPLGMGCSTYPGEGSRVCLWIEPARNMGTPK